MRIWYMIIYENSKSNKNNDNNKNNNHLRINESHLVENQLVEPGRII